MGLKAFRSSLEMQSGSEALPLDRLYRHLSYSSFVNSNIVVVVGSLCFPIMKSSISYERY